MRIGGSIGSAPSPVIEELGQHARDEQVPVDDEPRPPVLPPPYDPAVLLRRAQDLVKLGGEEVVPALVRVRVPHELGDVVDLAVVVVGVVDPGLLEGLLGREAVGPDVGAEAGVASVAGGRAEGGGVVGGTGGGGEWPDGDGGGSARPSVGGNVLHLDTADTADPAVLNFVSVGETRIRSFGGAVTPSWESRMDVDFCDADGPGKDR
ncbi:hypothetical protein THAOC_21657 [Thalassiosira oceanica]|uniref:Uncharacterized protein n=1 Tax=Thalassiosira oceanica TaxID=159749 RepID=K0SBF6_THAOC|nr:hypothetical protein THAOC_21657 [Thalassiosira oceanica]|eukprot:EJK58236.1 hypothetical protein THAOC_21657 [Thalassiosira oceanica]